MACDTVTSTLDIPGLAEISTTGPIIWSKVSELYLVYRPWMVRGSTTPRGQLLFKGPNKNQGGQKKAKKGTQIAEKVNFSRV
jgi:hypothetical protein